MAYGMDIISPFIQKDSKYFVSYAVFILAVPAGAAFPVVLQMSLQNIKLVIPRNGDSTKTHFLLCMYMCGMPQTSQSSLSSYFFS